MKRLVLFLAAILVATPAFADPVLRARIVVTAPVVTVADLFESAGAAADTALFRSPEPGTTGFVSLTDIREAAGRAGLIRIQTGDIAQVEVSRAGGLVDESLLADLIERDLATRGIIGSAMSAAIRFNRFVDPIRVTTLAAPAQLVSLRYLPQSGSFAARFQVAGQPSPLDLEGRIELEIEVPHLTANLPAGAVLRPQDIEMRRVPLKFAESNGFARFEDLVGKALNRQTRAGMVLKPSDVSLPKVVGRNEAVTLYFRAGALTLTAKGRALAAGGVGDQVSVLNPSSNKIVQAVVVAPGAVEILATPLRLAGL